MSTYLLNLFVMSVSIRSPQDNYYTSIPSIYVQLGDTVDCFICGVMLVGRTWYTDDSETNIRDDVTMMSRSELYVWFDE